MPANATSAAGRGDGDRPKYNDDLDHRQHWDELYKDGSSRKIDSRRLFSREYEFPKTFSLTENQFSGKTTYFYAIASSPRCRHHRGPAALGEEGDRAAEAAAAGPAPAANLSGERQQRREQYRVCEDFRKFFFS